MRYHAGVKRVLSIAALTAAVVVLVRPKRAGSGLAQALGRLLRPLRSGDAGSAANDPVLRRLPSFALHSAAFADGAPMRPPHVDAAALQPPLSWDNLPAGTREIALIVEDIDVPLPRPLVHALAYGIDPGAGSLEAGAIPRLGHPHEGDPAIRAGKGAGGRHFLPPTPIPGHGRHRYVFTVFALCAPLQFDRPPNSERFIRALRNVAIARASTTGTHER
jgi:phosphatidylethanolamine-binding protein (PEBP) family uncharacterized protein